MVSFQHVFKGRVLPFGYRIQHIDQIITLQFIELNKTLVYLGPFTVILGHQATLDQDSAFGMNGRQLGIPYSSAQLSRDLQIIQAQGLRKAFMLNLQATHFFLQQSDLCRIFLYSRKQLLLLNQKFLPLLYNLILSGLVFNLALQLNNALVQSVYLVKTFAKGCLFVVLDFAAHVVMEFLELREIILIKHFSLVTISLLFTAELRHLQFFHFYYKAKLNLTIKKHIQDGHLFLPLQMI